MEIDPKDWNDTSFTSHHELYRFIGMPSGLLIAPGMFQRVVAVILSTVTWQFALFYYNYILIFSRTPEEHMEYAQHVIFLLKTAGVTLMLKSSISSRIRSTTWVMLIGQDDWRSRTILLTLSAAENNIQP